VFSLVSYARVLGFKKEVELLVSLLKKESVVVLYSLLYIIIRFSLFYLLFLRTICKYGIYSLHSRELLENIENSRTLRTQALSEFDKNLGRQSQLERTITVLACARGRGRVEKSGLL